MAALSRSALDRRRSLVLEVFEGKDTVRAPGTSRKGRTYIPDTTHGTAIYADQLGWCQGGQWGGSPMAVPWVVFGFS